MWFSKIHVSRSVAVRVVAPNGAKINGTVTDVGDGNYSVEFTPSEIGIYKNKIKLLSGVYSHRV